MRSRTLHWMEKTMESRVVKPLGGQVHKNFEAYKKRNSNPAYRYEQTNNVSSQAWIS